MTRKLDLRTGRPVWHAYSAPSVPTGRLTRDIRTDVAIVCIDRRGPLLGSTAATTALVQFEIDRPLSKLARRIGRERAERAWRRSRLAVLSLRARIGELGIRCNMETRSSLYLAGDVLDAPALREEADARRLAGIHATHLAASQLQDECGIRRQGAILSHDNLALDPRKLTAGLLHRALERSKARFYAPVEAVSVRAGREEAVVATVEGPTITAGHVVLATGYELVADLIPATNHKIISTWAIATKAQRQALWPGRHLIWEASDPYLYLRATADGRVICGGEDEDFTDEVRRDALIVEKSDRISTKLKRLFPQLDAKPAFAWAGSFGTTPTGLPYIGTIPGHPRIHAAMGYGGNGITHSRIASEIISAAISGHRDADAELFVFPR